MSTSTKQPAYVTQSELARRCNVTRQAVHDWVLRGKVKTVRVSQGGAPLITLGEANRYVREHKKRRQKA